MCVYVLFLSAIVSVGCWRRLIQQCAEVACSSGALCAECSPNDKWGSRSPSPPPSLPAQWMNDRNLSGGLWCTVHQPKDFHILFTLSHQPTFSPSPGSVSLSHKTLIKEVFFSEYLALFLYLFFNGWLEAIEHVIWMNKQTKLFAWAGGEGGEGAWQEISGKFQLSLEGK